MPNYKDLSNPRQWRAAIGISEKQFLILKSACNVTHDKLIGISLSEKEKNLKQKFVFSTYEDVLFFVLFFLKNPVTFDVLGFIFGLDGSTDQRIIANYSKILEETLADCELLPARNFKDLAQFKQLIDSESEIIIDATEMSIQRPAEKEEQKKFYSGKKNDIP